MVAGLVMSLQKRYQCQVVQDYAHTSSHDDQPLEHVYDVEPAMANVNTQYILGMDTVILK